MQIGNGSLASGVLVGVFLLLSFGTISKPADAKVYLRGDCKKGYSIYRRKPAWKAFALSSDGYACGSGWGYANRKKAISRALSECYKRGRGCRVYTTSGKSRKLKKSSKRRDTSKVKLGKACRGIYKKWKTEPRYKAFAVTKRGSRCGYSWNDSSLDSAVATAIEGCFNRDCRVYSIGAAPVVIEKWQKDLKALKLYEGAIDSKWGPSTRLAMRKFAKIAKLKNIYSGGAFLQLHWAALIKTKYDVSAKKAIKNSEAALKAKSLEDVRKLVMATK